MASDSEVVLSLPAELRASLKDPLGPVFTDPERLLEQVDGLLLAVGDVVTHHLEAAGVAPDVALVDGMTEREVVEADVAVTIDRLVEGGGRPTVPVVNPAATLTRELLVALRDAVADGRSTVLVVDGEEDLAVLPAIAVAPVGASVVYGQPGAGMVHVAVTATEKQLAHDLMERMDGDYDRVCDLLDVTAPANE